MKNFIIFDATTILKFISGLLFNYVLIIIILRNLSLNIYLFVSHKKTCKKLKRKLISFSNFPLILKKSFVALKLGSQNRWITFMKLITEPLNAQVLQVVWIFTKSLSRLAGNYSVNKIIFYGTCYQLWGKTEMLSIIKFIINW